MALRGYYHSRGLPATKQTQIQTLDLTFLTCSKPDRVLAAGSRRWCWVLSLEKAMAEERLQPRPVTLTLALPAGEGDLSGIRSIHVVCSRMHNLWAVDVLTSCTDSGRVMPRQSHHLR